MSFGNFMNRRRDQDDMRREKEIIDEMIRQQQAKMNSNPFGAGSSFADMMNDPDYAGYHFIFGGGRRTGKQEFYRGFQSRSEEIDPHGFIRQAKTQDSDIRRAKEAGLAGSRRRFPWKNRMLPNFGKIAIDPYKEGVNGTDVVTYYFKA